MWSSFPNYWLPVGESRCGRRVMWSLWRRQECRSGQRTCLKIYLLVFVSPLFLTLLGVLEAPLDCSLFQGNCRRCSKLIIWTEGIFCVNFLGLQKIVDNATEHDVEDVTFLLWITFIHLLTHGKIISIKRDQTYGGQGLTQTGLSALATVITC